jgi:hypothetical protein
MGESERCIKSFVGENLRDRYHLEDPSVNGSIILIWILKKWREHRMD